MNHEEMSDHEVNKAVAINLELDYLVSACGRYISVESRMFDPCNSPSDAWPIIVDNGISTIKLNRSDMWLACSDVELETICMSPCGNDNGVSCMDSKNNSYHANPLRAAMIVFLMMKENQNEQ